MSMFPDQSNAGLLSERMPTFKQLESPRSLHLTPEMIGQTLEQQRIAGFPTLTPAGFSDAWWASAMGDTSYGARIGMVKKILAMSMYSPDDVKRFCEDASKSLSESNQDQQGNFRIVAENPELTRKAMAQAYTTLGAITNDIQQNWPNVSAEDILRLAEIDHYFSGKFNGTGIDATFADPKIRKVGADLQQVVERMWKARMIGAPNWNGRIIEDNPIPLSEEELFPVRGGIPENINTNSVEYSPFHPDLDEKFPIGTIRLTPESRDTAIRGEVNPSQWTSIFRNSPASNMEAEAVIGFIVTAAMRAGQWVDMERPEDQNIEGSTFNHPEEGQITLPSLPIEYKRGAQKLVDAGLVALVKDQEGRVYIRPTDKLTEFVNQRVGFYRPPKDLNTDPNLQ